ncbi:hypothetical protein AYO45_02480 [Gammaproteobacteria bacterium SCGC AG-212-F23]|nr:hypothetical protein AYO45_02480 [Gammaproteobacteria bacterium SCGC AG-212-F23]
MLHTNNALINNRQSALTEAERKQQTQLIMQLFAHWRLNYKQQAIVLGLSANTETSIYLYKCGKRYLPEYRDIQDRIKHLLTIHKYLRRAYSSNKELAYRWIVTPNTDFNLCSPFDVIDQEGHMGLVKIRHYLEANQFT